jgi:hypothetical protein
MRQSLSRALADFSELTTFMISILGRLGAS